MSGFQHRDVSPSWGGGTLQCWKEGTSCIGPGPTKHQGEISCRFRWGSWDGFTLVSRGAGADAVRSTCWVLGEKGIPSMRRPLPQWRQPWRWSQGFLWPFTSLNCSTEVNMAASLEQWTRLAHRLSCLHSGHFHLCNLSLNRCHHHTCYDTWASTLFWATSYCSTPSTTTIKNKSGKGDHYFISELFLCLCGTIKIVWHCTGKWYSDS